MTTLVQVVFRDALREDDGGLPFVLPAALNTDQLNSLLQQHLQTETTFQFFLGSFGCPIKASIESVLPTPHDPETGLVILYQPIEEGAVLADEDFPSAIKTIRGGYLGLFDGSLYQGTQLVARRLHKSAISAIAVDGDSVTTGSLDCTVKTGKRTVPLEQTVQCMHHCGAEIYAGLWDGRLAVIGKKTSTHVLHRSAIVFAHSLGVDGPLCTAGWDHRVTLWRRDKGEFTVLVSLMFPHAVSCGCAMDGDKLVFGHPNGTLSVVRVSSGTALECVGKVPRAHEGRISAVCALGPNGVASAGEDGLVKKWRCDTLHAVWSADLSSPIHCLDYFDGKLYVGRGSHLTVYQ